MDNISTVHKARPLWARRGSLLLRGLLLASTFVGAVTAQAQTYPTRPVKFFVGNPAGGLGDVIARTLGNALSVSMGQPFIVDNRAGASGVLATDAMAKAPPDGYSLLVAPDNMIVVNQFVFPKLPYDPNKDIRSVALIGKAALVLVAHPTLGVKTADEFFKLAKAQPQTIDYASGGPGHPLHLAMELTQNRLGISLVHVPYKGSAPAVQGLLGGEVKVMIVGVAEVLQHIKSGKLIALAATGPGAETLFPGLPLLKSYSPDLDMSVWFGLFAPAGTKPEVISTLNAATNNYLSTSEAKAKLAEFGVAATPAKPSDLDALIQSDRAKYEPLIKQLGLRVK